MAAAGLAACAPAATGAGWTFGPSSAAERRRARRRPRPSRAAAPRRRRQHVDGAERRPAASASAATGRDMPAGWTEHDVAARNVVRRYIGNLAPALADIYPEPVFAKLADILGVEDDYPELDAEAGVRPGPAARPQRRADAAQARRSTAT